MHWKRPGWFGAAIYALGASLIGAVIGVLGRFQHWRTRSWLDAVGELPDGPLIVIANHTSLADGLLLATLSHRLGRPARILATSGVFKIPIVGWLARQVGFIPVRRGSADARTSLDAAEAAIAAGEVIALFPEGRTTRDPDKWPERGKTGAVRLALRTAAPIVPIAFVGAHQLIPRNPLKLVVRFVRRPVVDSVIGDPIDVGPLVDDPDDPAEVRAATDVVMSHLVDLVETLRGEYSPAPFGVPKRP